MVRIVLAVGVVMLLSAVAFTVQKQDAPRATVEVKQLAGSSEPAGRVEVKELPAPDMSRQKSSVEIEQLPSPEATALPPVRQS